MKIKYKGKGQHWEDEITIYWFFLDGTEHSTGIIFHGDTYGLADSNGSVYVVGADGVPLNTIDPANIAVLNTCTITDEMKE